MTRLRPSSATTSAQPQPATGHDRLPRRWFRGTAAVLGASLAFASLAACSSDSTSAAVTGTTSTGEWGDSSVRTASYSDGTVWDSSTVHTISVEMDEAEYAAMLETYVTTEEKDWISATVTIDGETFTDVGLRLKGNSSLKSLSTTNSEAEDLPWLIRLDKYVDDQNLDGSTNFVVRSSSMETSINEAVALELLDEAGLASQEAISTRFSINGSAETLRLAIELPDETWDAAEFETEGILYKAEAEGDYTYRGDDAESYVDVFDQETGEDNLEPLIEFLQFINESDDETFAAELSDHLDVDAFATYLAVQDLVANNDDIDGRGNNSYLRYDTTTGAFTVVNWDLNLAFGQTPATAGSGETGVGGVGGVGGDRGALPDGAEIPEGATPPDGAALPEGAAAGEELPEGATGGRPDGATGQEGMAGQGGAGAQGGGMEGNNVLSTRFLADAGFAALYDQALTDLKASLYTSGEADAILTTWTDMLTDQASDLVDAETIASEAAVLHTVFTS
ncbi:CotH kinase family protein [Sanguibacter antarcticus]|uniref:Spore coat protein CotH n=1 Tax=Sanguibacter antarcticus TaxID=372484 RepID=A0A2A9E1E3_9MICO|nr:CotH kinase family protein [Sanguibacter antarcticus]PFG32768.1 spore coat protein CotH [Sanguibacter antarcticus]